MSTQSVLLDTPAIESAIDRKLQVSPSSRPLVSNVETREEHAQETDNCEKPPSHSEHSMVLPSGQQDDFDAPPSPGLRSRTQKQSTASGTRKGISRSPLTINGGTASNVLKGTCSGATEGTILAPNASNVSSRKRQRRAGSAPDKDDTTTDSTVPQVKPATSRPRRRGKTPKRKRNPSTKKTMAEASSSNLHDELRFSPPPGVTPGVVSAYDAVTANHPLLVLDIDTPCYPDLNADPIKLQDHPGVYFAWQST